MADLDLHMIGCMLGAWTMHRHAVTECLTDVLHAMYLWLGKSADLPTSCLPAAEHSRACLTSTLSANEYVGCIYHLNWLASPQICPATGT